MVKHSIYYFISLSFFAFCASLLCSEREEQTMPDIRNFSESLSNITDKLEGLSTLHISVYNKNYDASRTELRKFGAGAVFETNYKDSTALEYAIYLKDLNHITMMCRTLKRAYKQICKNDTLYKTYFRTISNAKMLAVHLNDPEVINHLNREIDLIESSTGCCCFK